MKRKFNKLYIHLLKITLCFTAVFLLSARSQLMAQSVSLYSFNATSGTFVALTGGTTMPLSGGSTDDGYYNNIPIGFIFNYEGIPYTTAAGCTNGWLSLIGTMTENAWTNNLRNGLTPARPVLAPLWDDNDGTGITFTYKSEAISGGTDSLFTAEWLDVDWQFQGGSTISYQVKLFRNSGKVQFIYRQEPTAVAFCSASIGISGVATGNGNFVSLSNSSASPALNSITETTNIATKPATGQVYEFTPPTPALANVTTGAFTNVTTNSATLAGSIAPNAFPVITASGVIFSTTPLPTRGDPGVVDSTTNPLITSGTMNLNITGLSNGTIYYYRAYAVNSLGTAYGTVNSFTTNSSAVVPAVLGMAALNIGTTSVTLGGDITSDGGDPVTGSGIVYGITPNPTVGNPGVVDSATSPAILTGMFTINPTGLTHSTKYYFRAYATNSIGVGYSILDSFTTQPIVSTLPYSENFDGVSTLWSSAAIGGGLNDWQLGTPAKTTISSAFSAPNAFVTKLTGPYSTTSYGAVLSPQFDFTSSVADPVLRFKHIFDEDSDPGYDGGVVQISINGGAWTTLDDNSGTGANYNTPNSSGWYNDNSGDNAGGLGLNTFSGSSNSYASQSGGWITSTTSLTGAAGQSDVKIRFAFAADVFTDEGWAIDNIEIIQPTTPVVSTGNSTGITTSEAILSGNIISNGLSPITASGIVFSTTPAPLRGDPGVVDSASSPLATGGTFNVSLTGLNSAMTYYFRAYAVNAVGTTYGADSTFMTNSSAVAPSVLKLAAINITTTSATLRGSILSNGGDAITASGVVYSTSPNPAIGDPTAIDSATIPAVTSGSFLVNPTGLVHSTKYYYRAYAQNSVGYGYSIQDSFTTAPIISALPYNENFDGISTPWSSTALGGGTNDWQLGTPAKNTLIGAFSAPNAFVTKITGDYSGNSNGAVISPQFDFTAETADPVLRFKHIFDEDNDPGYDGGVIQISINGGAWTTLDDNGGSGANYNTTNSVAWYNDGSGLNAGGLGLYTFSGLSSDYVSESGGWITSTTSLTGAAGQANVKVRFRFAADGFTDDGWAVDNIEIIRPTAPVVTTGVKTNITTNSATLAGNIGSNGLSSITSSGIVFSTTPAPVRGNPGVVDSASTPLATNGTFTINVTGLNLATTYYYRAYAVNSVGTTYGADSTFTTNAAAVQPSVSIITASNIGVSTVTLGGNITSDGGDPVTISGVVYATTTLPAIGGPGVVDSTTNPLVTTGTYTVQPVGLTHSTKYYFRAYAINSVGVGYSALDSFTTSPIISSFPYLQTFDIPGNTGWASAGTGGVNDWVLGTPAKAQLSGAYSSPNAWVTKLAGNYNDGHNAAVVSPQFDFSATTTDPILRFRHNFRTETGYDAAIIEISINNGTWVRVDSTLGTGTNFNTPNSYSWYNSTSTNGPVAPRKWSNSSTLFSTQASGWILSQTALTGALGQANVRVRMRFQSDGVDNDQGWAFDNVEVFEVIAPSVQVSSVVINNLTNTTANVNWTNGNGQARIVVARLTATTDATPNNMTLYNANAAFGSGSTTGTGNYVVYSGTGSSVTVTGLTLLTDYTFTVYEYNGSFMHTRLTNPGVSNNGTTLPVTLTSFTASAKKSDVLLSWTTSTETNNAGFDIEKSLDGRTFERTGDFVKGAGNSRTVKNYATLDANAFVKARVVYYRLKQVDLDGKFTYSPMVKVSAAAQSLNALSVFPNPYNTTYNVSFNAATEGDATIEMTDLQGRVITSQTSTVTVGDNTIPMNNVSTVNTGIYFVRVIKDGETTVIKLVKN